MKGPAKHHAESVQSEFARRVIEVHGQGGRVWLKKLPALIAACERRWSIAVQAPFADLSYNWVAPAMAADGAPVVLKLGVPNPELASEIEALTAWAGAGAAQLIAADAAQGAVILERLVPGTRLAQLGFERDDEATTVAAGLMQQLHRTEPPPGLPTLAEWTDGVLRAKAACFAPSLVGKAARLRDQLLASSSQSVLLHGDLHHFNILSAERQPWLAIDPKGIAGDPAYEPAPFLYNPVDRVPLVHDLQKLVARRIDIFSERFDRQRIIGWTLVQSVLHAWWSFEDHAEQHEQALEFAERFSSVL